MKKHRGYVALFPLLAALAATAAILLLYVWESVHISKRPVTDFSTQTEAFCYAVEQTETGRFTSHFSGYGFATDQLIPFYNFGNGISGEGLYINLDAALVKDDMVYILPSVQTLRPELLQLPEAEALSGVLQYNFYAGVEARCLNFLLPSGIYQTAIVSYEQNEPDRLLISDKEWVKQ